MNQVSHKGQNVFVHLATIQEEGQTSFVKDEKKKKNGEISLINEACSDTQTS